MSNFYTYASDLAKDPSYDRGNVYTMAVAVGHHRDRLRPASWSAEEITSWQDLLDPALKGKIGMFGDNRGPARLARCARSASNPETSTEADWKKAADWLKKQQPLVRKYYDQAYIDALSKGDIWASMAWSGDIFQANAVRRRPRVRRAQGGRGDLDGQHVHPAARRAPASTR